MFARTYRLPYSAYLKQANHRSFSIFNVKYQSNHLSNNRYGFIIGKKIDRLAVKRNRTKRVLRSEVELLHPNLKSGFDFLFFLKKPITNENNQKAREEVREFFKNEKLFSNSLIINN